MSSPDAVHFSIENFNEDFNMLTIIPRSNILELNFVHPEGHKTMCFEWIGRSWIFTLCENKSVRLTWNNPQVTLFLACIISHMSYPQIIIPIQLTLQGMHDLSQSFSKAVVPTIAVKVLGMLQHTNPLSLN